jgi:hypothetical protein
MDPFTIQKIIVAEKRLREEKAAPDRRQRSAPPTAYDSQMDPFTNLRIFMAEQREREEKAALDRRQRSAPPKAYDSATTRRLVVALGSLGAATLMIAQLMR